MAEPIPERPKDDPAPERRRRYIGQPFRRVDGRDKVTGRTRFADDLVFPRMAHMKLTRSTVPHARRPASASSRAPGTVSSSHASFVPLK